MMRVFLQPGLFLLLVLCAAFPAAFALLLLIATFYATHDLLCSRRLHDKTYLGHLQPTIQVRDRAWIWYQLLLVSGYAYVLSCRLPHAYLAVVAVVLLTLTLRLRLRDGFAQRRFFLYGSLMIGLGYSVIVLLAGQISFTAVVWSVLEGVIRPPNACGLVQLFDAFNALTDAMIRLLPFPFDLLLAPLNLNLLFGPLVTSLVLAILKLTERVAAWDHPSR
jgi:hypothetical protein